MRRCIYSNVLSINPILSLYIVSDRMDSCLWKYIDHSDLSLRRYFLFVMPKSIFGISVELYADFIYIILMDFFFLFLILQSMKSVNIWLTQKMFGENKNRCRQIKDRGLNKIQDIPNCVNNVFMFSFRMTRNHYWVLFYRRISSVRISWTGDRKCSGRPDT